MGIRGTTRVAYEMTSIRGKPRIYASLLFVLGGTLAAGGIKLAMLGGSLYYLSAGAIIIVSAIFLWRGRRLGAWLYAAMVLGSVAWALLEVGLDFWQLWPRIATWFVLGLWLLRPSTRKSLR